MLGGGGKREKCRKSRKARKKTGASLFRLSSGASLLQGHVVKTFIVYSLSNLTSRPSSLKELLHLTT